jgi:hypothetical protein
MSVIKPGKDAHRVMAMASNRIHGLNGDAGETMRPQPFSLVGDGDVDPDTTLKNTAELRFSSGAKGNRTPGLLDAEREFLGVWRLKLTASEDLAAAGVDESASCW